MKKKLLAVLVLLTALYACGVKSARTLKSEREQGKEIYFAKCGGKCHPSFEVKSKPIERWDQVLAPMIKDKARLVEADGKLVEAYVWYELGVKRKPTGK